MLQRQAWFIRCLPLVAFVAVYVATFVAVSQWTKPYVGVFIPLAEYMGAIGMNLGLHAVLRGIKKVETTGVCAGAKLGLAAFLGCVAATIGCSIAAQRVYLGGSSAGGLMVYVPMCILIPLSLLALRAALPFPGPDLREDISDSIDAAAEETPPRLPTEGWTTCCHFGISPQK